MTDSEVKGNNRQNKNLVLKGTVVSGAGEAAFFTQLDWVQSQCEEKFGFKPFPGTLNVEIADETLVRLQMISSQLYRELIPPDPEYCKGLALPVKIGDIKGALIIPSEEARIHDRKVMEIMAPCRIKDAMGLQDRDTIEVRIVLD